MIVAGLLTVAGVDGGIVIGIGLLATSLGLIVPVLADSGALDKPVGRLAIAGASAGEIAAVVVLSVGLAGSDTPPAGKLLLLGLLLLGLGAIAAVVIGAEHSMRITEIIRRSADTSAQIRIRLTVLLVAGLALAAEGLGFEAILGAFLAGVLVRSLDPEPEKSHPLYPVKLEAVGFGLLVPIFFVTSGLKLDLSGLVDSPSAILLVPVFLVALCIVRGLPALVFRRDLGTRDVVVVGLLQATSLPFLLTVSQIGAEMDLIEPATAAGLITAGLVSVLVFPAVALRLISKEESHADSKATLSQ